MQVKITKFEEDLHRRDPKSSDYLESMLTRFNRIIQASGLYKELKRREFYEKPSDKRKRKRHEAELRLRRKEREDAVYKGRVQKTS